MAYKHCTVKIKIGDSLTQTFNQLTVYTFRLNLDCINVGDSILCIIFLKACRILKITFRILLFILFLAFHGGLESTEMQKKMPGFDTHISLVISQGSQKSPYGNIRSMSCKIIWLYVWFYMAFFFISVLSRPLCLWMHCPSKL